MSWFHDFVHVLQSHCPGTCNLIKARAAKQCYIKHISRNSYDLRIYVHRGVHVVGNLLCIFLRTNVVWYACNWFSYMYNCLYSQMSLRIQLKLVSSPSTLHYIFIVDQSDISPHSLHYFHTLLADIYNYITYSVSPSSLMSQCKHHYFYTIKIVVMRCHLKVVILLCERYATHVCNTDNQK